MGACITVLGTGVENGGVEGGREERERKDNFRKCPVTSGQGVGRGPRKRWVSLGLGSRALWLPQKAQAPRSWPAAAWLQAAAASLGRSGRAPMRAARMQAAPGGEARGRRSPRSPDPRGAPGRRRGPNVQRGLACPASPRPPPAEPPGRGGEEPATVCGGRPRTVGRTRRAVGADAGSQTPGPPPCPAPS